MNNNLTFKVMWSGVSVAAGVGVAAFFVVHKSVSN